MKLRTKSCCKKRFRITKNGKVMKKKAGTRHNLGSKHTQRKRDLRKENTLNKVDGKVIKALMPYA